MAVQPHASPRGGTARRRPALTACSLCFPVTSTEQLGRDVSNSTPTLLADCAVRKSSRLTLRNASTGRAQSGARKVQATADINDTLHMKCSAPSLEEGMGVTGSLVWYSECRCQRECSCVELKGLEAPTTAQHRGSIHPYCTPLRPWCMCSRQFMLLGLSHAHLHHSTASSGSSCSYQMVLLKLIAGRPNKRSPPLAMFSY